MKLLINLQEMTRRMTESFRAPLVYTCSSIRAFFFLVVYRLDSSFYSSFRLSCSHRLLFLYNVRAAAAAAASH